MTVSNNTPSAGYISWSGIHLQFVGNSYAIADGNTNKMFAYWTLTNPTVLQTSDTFPALTANDCVVFHNNNGVATVVPISTVLPGGLIVPGSITADRLNANEIFANYGFLQRLSVGAAYKGSTPPEAPVVGQLWRNSGVTPNELLAWSGEGVNNLRRYARSQEAAIVPVKDLSDTDDRAFNITVKTAAKQTVTARGQNDCPPANSGKWNLKNGAYIDAEGYIVLPDMASYAFVTIPWLKRSGSVIIGATVQSNDSTPSILITTQYRDATNADVLDPSGNGFGAAVGTNVPKWVNAYAWDDGSIYAISRRNASYIGLYFEREATVSPLPFRFKDPYFGMADSAAPVAFVPESPSPWYPAPITPAVAAGGNVSIKRCGKNLLSMSMQHTFRDCTDNGNGSVTLNLRPMYYATLATSDPTFLGMLMQSKGLTFTFSCLGMPTGTVASIIIFGQRNGIPSLQEENGFGHPKGFVSATVANDFTSITEVNLRFGRKGTSYTDTTSIISNFQFELGPVATDYEPYSGADYALPVQQAMYGVSGAEDERGSDGHETHKTAIVTLTGGENWYIHSGWSNNCFYSDNAIPGSESIAGYDTIASMVCSHFPTDTPARIALTAGVSGVGVSATMLYLGFGSDTATVPFQDVAAFRAWIQAQASAGTPVQIVYQLAIPTTISQNTTQITGVDGVNTIFSDQALVQVDYTGSGWASVGSVKRIGIENVEITPEKGLVIRSLLTDNGLNLSTRTEQNHSGFRIVNDATDEFLAGLMSFLDAHGNAKAGLLTSIIAKAQASVAAAGIPGGYAYPSNRFYAPHLAEELTDNSGTPMGSSAPFGLTFMTRDPDDGVDKFSGFVGGGYGVLEEDANGILQMVQTPYIMASSMRLDNVIASWAYWVMYKGTFFLRGTFKTSDQAGSRKGIGITSGRKEFTIPGSQTQTMDVQLGAEFEEEPSVVQSLEVFDDLAGDVLHVWISALTTNTVTFKLKNSVTSSRAGFINWHAAGTIIHRA